MEQIKNPQKPTKQTDGNCGLRSYEEVVHDQYQFIRSKKEGQSTH